MKASEAISAGLLTELMTVVIQPEDPEAEPIIPAKLEGRYKLSSAEKEGDFAGYELVISQTSLTASSISGEFEGTNEFIKFMKELQDAGATLKIESTGAKKYTSKEAIDNKLTFDVRYSKTTIEGEFEVSEGVVTIKQKVFLIQGKPGEFATAQDLFKFIEKCLEELKIFDEVKKMWTRQGYAVSKQEDYSERSLERNRNFWANPDKYIEKIESRSNLFGQRFFNFGRR